MSILLYSCLGALTAVYLSSIMFSSKKLRVQGLHCCIPGGSQGLGLAVACQLAARGAHVTLMARTQSKLDAAIEQVKIHSVDASQRIQAVSVDLTDPASCNQAFDKAEELQGRPVDLLISCVGGAGPCLGLFEDLSPDQLRTGMDTNYFATLWPVREAVKRMIAQKVKGKIVLVSSLVGFFSFVGYAGYSPAKFALRGLADTLRNELRMHDISVHCYFPATILSPGFDEEEKVKPALTKKIEGADDGQTPEVCATKLLRGLDNGNYIITSDIVGDLFRTSMRGIAPYNNLAVDLFWSTIGAIGIPIWRAIADREVTQWARRQPS